MKMNLTKATETLQLPLMKRLIAMIVAVAVFHVSLAIAEPSQGIDGLSGATLEAESAPSKRVETVIAELTKFEAVPGQTDSSPCLTADMTYICGDSHGNVAAVNWLKFGTRIYIPDLNMTYVVHDRMNARYQYPYVDLLTDSHQEAKQFGRRNMEIVILN